MSAHFLLVRAYGSESYAKLKRHDFMYLYFKIALLAGNPLQVGGRERGVCVCVCVWGGVLSIFGRESTFKWFMYISYVLIGGEIEV